MGKSEMLLIKMKNSIPASHQLSFVLQLSEKEGIMKWKILSEMSSQEGIEFKKEHLFENLT